ncbi:uncharacterized protein LOC133720443 [Rosa rugosa]|uniref:uncharacterized protein LOC133720443 n=1 Tax=Rosa rugosa TaxID=74645 RepID=UPI002B4178D1|nr:uncharacterized protein LOC133720443 [Rosa rugosa]
MVKPGGVPSKIRESTRFYPYFKDCIGAIDGTHIPTMVKGREVSSYRNRHGIQSQNVLAACNFDLEFIYVLSGWEGLAHDSKLLNDALSRRNGIEVPQEDDQSSSYLDMEDENLELLSQSQQQQRAEANAWRISIADAMWNDRPWNDDNGNQEDNNEDQDNDNENNEEHINDENQEVYDDNEVGMEEYASF